MKQFKNEFVAVFGNDYIHVGRYVIRPFSFAWWVTFFAQGAIGAFVMYVFYLIMWLALG